MAYATNDKERKRQAEIDAQIQQQKDAQVQHEQDLAAQQDAEYWASPEGRARAETARQQKYFDKFVQERDAQLAALEDQRKKQREQEVQIAVNSALARRNRAQMSGVGAGPFSGGGLSGFSGFGGFVGQLRPRVSGY